MNRPLVSVVIAIKNAERYLGQALDSIAAQSFQDYEIIVVDGGSTDRGPQIATARPRVRLITQAGAGFANAWNCGIAISQAPFIALLDSDDEWLPDKLAIQVHHLDSHPEHKYVIGRVQYFVASGDPIPAGFRPELLNGSHVAHMPGTSLIRRNLFEQMGPFQEHWQIASDIEWFGRVREQRIELGVINAVVLRKRVHSANLSYVTSWSVYRKELLQLLRASVDRRREPDFDGKRSG